MLKQRGESVKYDNEIQKSNVMLTSSSDHIVTVYEIYWAKNVTTTQL